VRVQGCPTPVRNESDSGCIFAQSAGPNPSGEWSECEHVCWETRTKESNICASTEVSNLRAQ
jgi:hypothetical protein